MYHLIDYIWCVEKFDSFLNRQAAAATTTTSSETVGPDTSTSNNNNNNNNNHQIYPLLTSPVFAYKNTRWVLNLYPEGLGDASSAGYVSLFIKYVSEEPESICAKVELSLLNNNNERVHCRDTGDHAYQTFIDFGYKQFLKLSELREQRSELLTSQGHLKVFARVEFEMAGTLPASVSWANYDLLLLKEQFKTLYETKHLCDILVRVVRTKHMSSGHAHCALPLASSPPVINRAGPSDASSPKSKRIKLSDSQIWDTPAVSPTTHLPSIFAMNSCTCAFDFSSSYLATSSSCELSHPGLATSSPSALESAHNHDTSSRASSRTSPSLFEQQQQHVEEEPPHQSLLDEALDIKAHKFILASRSGKFRELLKTNLIKIGQQSIHGGADSCGCFCTCSTVASSDVDGDCLHSSSVASSSSASSSAGAVHEQHDECFSPGYMFAAGPESSSLATSSGLYDSEQSDIADLLIIETDRSPKVIEYLIRYMYTGYLDSLDAYSRDIYEISKEFKVHGLTALAREHLAKELNVTNCCDFLIFCVVNNDYELNTKVQAFIQDNYEAVIKTHAYKQARRKYRELFENTFGEIFKKMAPAATASTSPTAFGSVSSRSASAATSAFSPSAAATSTSHNYQA